MAPEDKHTMVLALIAVACLIVIIVWLSLNSTLDNEKEKTAFIQRCMGKNGMIFQATSTGREKIICVDKDIVLEKL